MLFLARIITIPLPNLIHLYYNLIHPNVSRPRPPPPLNYYLAIAMANYQIIIILLPTNY